MRIGDPGWKIQICDPGWRRQDQGSRINIPDPQHWKNENPDRKKFRHSPKDSQAPLTVKFSKQNFLNKILILEIIWGTKKYY